MPSIACPMPISSRCLVFVTFPPGQINGAVLEAAAVAQPRLDPRSGQWWQLFPASEKPGSLHLGCLIWLLKSIGMGLESWFMFVPYGKWIVSFSYPRGWVGCLLALICRMEAIKWYGLACFLTFLTLVLVTQVKEWWIATLVHFAPVGPMHWNLCEPGWATSLDAQKWVIFLSLFCPEVSLTHRIKFYAKCLS